LADQGFDQPATIWNWQFLVRDRADDYDAEIERIVEADRRGVGMAANRSSPVRLYR
jgi:hypothetical protein